MISSFKAATLAVLALSSHICFSDASGAKSCDLENVNFEEIQQAISSYTVRCSVRHRKDFTGFGLCLMTRIQMINYEGELGEKFMPFCQGAFSSSFASKFCERSKQCGETRGNLQDADGDYANFRKFISCSVKYYMKFCHHMK